MSSNFVTREEYDKEMAALLARIDTLAAIVSTMQRANVPNRVADLEHQHQPLAARGIALPETRTPGIPGVC